MHYKLNSKEEITGDSLQGFLRILSELQAAHPIQHVLGTASFYGLQLAVNPHTLIPRPETEELVDWILTDYRQRKELAILDVGTGSGCIALALKKHLPCARVDAIDLQGEAIAVARKNAVALHIPVNFIQADILEWDSFMSEAQRYDIIVSNPPYITPGERKHMHDNVLLHEPHSALFVEEHMPLLFFEVIAEMGKKHLVPDGALYFEINQYLAAETQDLILKKGYEDVALRQDLNQASRMIKAKF